ncbi:MAG: DUF1538 family protein [Bacilli bacterium]|nr:DUF1538 family protein [Bacilli bacterium]
MKIKNNYLKSIVTASISITPIIVVCLVMALIKLIDFNAVDYIFLAIGGVSLILGLALFSVGCTSGLTKIGEYMGSSLSRQKNILVVITFAFLLGTLITLAEPSILIVAGSVSIDKWLLLGGISVGVGLFVVIGVIRIIIHGQLKVWYLFLYFIVFILICLIKNGQYLPFIFDAGGITTGSATVPFILSLGLGIATVRSGKDAHKDSFGLVGVASIGPILTMTLIIIINEWIAPQGFAGYDISAYGAFDSSTWGSVLKTVVNTLLPSSMTKMGTMIEVLIAMLPIILIFLVYELIYIKLPVSKIWSMIIGFGISYVGLVLFLTAVGSCLTPIGRKIGVALGSIDNVVVILFAFLLGMVTILCEPAVHVLTKQIEDVSSGTIKRSTILFALALGVGLAIALAITRSIYQFSVMYYIVPGYLLSIALMFVTPDLFTAIAFDSGGTASGPVAVSFVLPLAIGIFITKTPDGNVYEFAFGLVALIALTPIIAIQIIGVSQKISEELAIRRMRMQPYEADDEQIIHF